MRAGDRALISNPSILLADEPTGNLDTRTSVEIMEIFQRLNQERRLTILLVTHEEDIARYAQRMVTFRMDECNATLQWPIDCWRRNFSPRVHSDDDEEEYKERSEWD